MQKHYDETNDIQYLSANHLASSLEVSTRTIRRWNSSGKIPAPRRIGGSDRWSLSEIKLWLAAGTPDRKTWESLKESEYRKGA